MLQTGSPSPLETTAGLPQKTGAEVGHSGRSTDADRNRQPLIGTGVDSRHLRILVLLARDATMGSIAADLHLSPHGVKYHIDRLRAFFGVRSQAALIAAAFAAGLLSISDGAIQALSAETVAALFEDKA